jgi:group I intron endonuclease
MFCFDLFNRKEFREVISGVYSIQQISNEKIYVGSSIDIFKRWREHIRRAKLLKQKDISPRDKMGRALKCYPVDSWRFSVLELTSPSDAPLRETFWIGELDTYHNGYNSTLEGTSTFGTKYSDASKKLLSERAKGRVTSEETKQLLSQRMKNRKFSETHRARLKEAMSSRMKERKGWDPNRLARLVQTRDNSGENNNFFGKKHSESSRELMSLRIKEHFKTHPASSDLRARRAEVVKGSKLMTRPDGKVVRVYSGEIESKLKEGWVLGRVKN